MEVKFHNTIGISGEERRQCEQKAQKQDELILAIFQRFPGYWLTPYEVIGLLSRQGNIMLMTSVRRAISNLTAAGLLVKSEKALGKGLYQVRNHKWTLAVKEIA